MNIIIIGAGEVGRHFAEDLSSRNHNICVIDLAATVGSELSEKLDARTITGNGASVHVLEEANVAGCDLLLALTSDDNTNLVAASLGKALGAKKTIARVHAGVQREEWLFDYREHFKIDHIFSSERLAAVELAKFIRNPQSLVVEEIARGRIEVQRLQVLSGCQGAGKKIRELGFPARVRVGLIQREGESFVPNAESLVHVDDLVTLFGEPRKLSEVKNLLRTSEDGQRERSVVIFGGGEAAYALAQMLEAERFTVRIFERDERRCAYLAETLQSTVIIHADATSLDNLREEQVGRADFFVAATGDDEDNVMTCLQANHLGTQYCLAMIHRADYAEAIIRFGKQIGILGAVSPREASKRDLLRFVTEESYHSVMELGDDAELIQVIVSENSRASEHLVSELDWPEGSGLVALLHGQQAIVPAAEDRIQAGDAIYAIVSREAKKPFLKLVS